MILSDEEKRQALESILELAATLDIQHIGLDKPYVHTRSNGTRDFAIDSQVRIITIIGTVQHEDRRHGEFELPTESTDADAFPFELGDDDDEDP